jgi:hypothetical protein
MSRQLIGQVLSRMGKLSSIDVDEILFEQAMSQRRFGEIALSWGLCEPEHLAEAWCRQLAENSETLDLAQVGVDAHAARALPAEVARRLGVVPIRVLGDTVVVATGHLLDSVEVTELSRTMGRDVRFVAVAAGQLDHAMKVYYSSPVTA